MKERIVRERQFKNVVLQWEDVAEFDYRPTCCQQTYRRVALRKKISVEQGQDQLFEEYRCFFYITSDYSRDTAVDCHRSWSMVQG